MFFFAFIQLQKLLMSKLISAGNKKNYHAPQWKRTVRERAFLWPPRCFLPDQVALPQERPQVFAHRSYTVLAMPKIDVEHK